MKECKWEKKDCRDCFIIEEYKLAMKIYNIYLSEKYGSVKNNPFILWLNENITEQTK